MKTKLFIILLSAIWGFSLATAQQVADTTFNPELKKPEYGKGTGPVVLIDAGILKHPPSGFPDSITFQL